MTSSIPSTDTKLKIAELQKRLLQNRPITLVNTSGEAHILFNSAKKRPTDVNLSPVFQDIRHNFKNYTVKAKHHINSHFLAPNAEQKVIDTKYDGDIQLQKLAKYLDRSLQDFEKNVNRFLPNIQNTDYKLEININGKNNQHVSIGFKNEQGKQIGPYLETHITTSPLDGYDVLSVDIGYINKHKQRVCTTSFGYDSIRDVDNYEEQRGNETFIKTDSQRHHDKYQKLLTAEAKSRLQKKNRR